MTIKDFEEIKHTIPRLPGVYRYIDHKDVVIYVGKAKVLRNRLSSYFGSRKGQAYRTRVMVKNAVRIEFTIVDTEQDALLLENSLIKQLQPRYNVMLKDGKSYSYICIKNERFPRVFMTRRVRRDGSLYFGPYTSKHTANQILDLIKKIFQLRTCNFNLSQENIDAGKFKVCLEYHIKNCLGPCEGLESEENYSDKIDQIKNILKGNFALVKDYIKMQMEFYAEEFKYEQAQVWKEKLGLFEDYQSKSTVVSTRIKDVDVFSYVEAENSVYVNYLKVVNGAILNTHSVELKKNLEENQENILLYAIINLRDKFNSIAPELIVPFNLEFPDENVKSTVPQIGDKKKLLDLSTKNATYHKLQDLKEKVTKDRRRTSAERILKTLQKDLQMEEVPFHIECFDNSNMQGTNPTASCVVFKNARPSKKDYRHFHVKTVEGPDDFASMTEIVHRRYSRLLKEKEPLPQLVVIDGGKGQLSAAMKSIDELGIRSQLTVIGIAKRLEEIYFPEDSIPLYINKKSESLKLIQQCRNEAHRFAITFHRQIRSKNFIKTGLTTIPGVGEKSAQKLLKHFGSVNRMKEAELDTIATVVNRGIAVKVKEWLNNS